MSSEKLVLKSSDGEIFEVDQSVMFVSEFIKNMVEDGVCGTIPLPDISSKTLVKVIDYCKRYSNGSTKKKGKQIILVGEADGDEKKRKAEIDEERKWEEKFLKVDQQTICDLILAANFLNIPGLLELGTENIASMIRGKTVEQIRETFNVENDFSPEEEEKIRMKLHGLSSIDQFCSKSN